MNGDPGEFDLSAAWLRKSQGDLKSFMEGFAARMAGALPGRVSVERKRDGLFSTHSHVVKVTVAMDHHVYILNFDTTRLSAQRARAVRGVTLKSDALPVPEWLAALNLEVQAMAEQAGSAQTVIHDFLMS